MRVCVRRKNLIGVIGIGKTHISIALSNYLSNCLGLKVAYVEVSAESQLDYMFGEQVEIQEGLVGFIKEEVTYYTLQKAEEIQRVFAMDYDVIIVEFAQIDYEADDMKVIYQQLAILHICSMKDYRKKKTYKEIYCINKYDIWKKEHYLVNSSKKERKEFYMDFKVHGRQMPVIRNTKDFTYEEKEALLALYCDCVGYYLERSRNEGVFKRLKTIGKTLLSK